MQQDIVFDPKLLMRYDKSGPRYTSYPTSVQFHDGFGEENYRCRVAQSNELSRAASKPTPLSLYFHIPFCDTVCFYCGCSKIATKDRSKAEPYLTHLFKEIAIQASLFDDDRKVDQLHWGGGTPTFISHQQMRQLMQFTRENFSLHDDDSGEYSIEIDPREVTPETVSLLREIGFNRMSMGVQDFAPRVQKAVNRIQSEAVTFSALEAARKENFKSISIDLIYGLPFQTAESFAQTVDKIIDVLPDRLSVFNYAHLPEMFKPQRRINETDLPSLSEKLAILQNTIQQLTEAGYVYIGMDHFARPDDELAVAQREGSLYRNFQGYSTHAECDLVAMGVTSIGMVNNSYSQNAKTVEEYYAALNDSRLPIIRGIELSNDDILRREIITRLICHFMLDIPAMERQFNIDFSACFSHELGELSVMMEDGLLELKPAYIEVLPRGRLLIRNICMVFDKYLGNKQQQRFSKVI